MSSLNHISQDDLLLFAMQMLPEGEMTSAHDHILTCEDCRKQLAWIQGDLASYALTSEALTPPAAARERLMRAIAKEKRLSPRPVAEAAIAAEPQVELTRRDNVFSIEDAPVKRRMGFAGWAGWAVAAAAIVAGGFEFQQTQKVQNELGESHAELMQLSTQADKANLIMETLTNANAKQVALTLPSSTPALPEGHASYLGSKGSLVFVANHMTAVDPSKTYELWLIPSGKDAKPIPAGTFKPDTQGRVSMFVASLPKNVDVSAFGVTVEPDGGSQAPTLPIVLMGD